MKKIFLCLAVFALAASVMTSCKKDENTGLVFHAVMENPDGKTLLNTSTNRMNWEAGDRIAVTNKFETGIYKATNVTSDGTGADFELDNLHQILGDRYYAYYPSAIFDSTQPGNLLSVVLPENQTYDATRQMVGYPMYAVSDGATLRFKNICAVLKLHLQRDNTTITRIIVKTDKAICGPLALDTTNFEVQAGTGNTHHSVTLNCGAAGVDINSGADFYIYLPVGGYSQFDIRAYTADHNKFDINYTGATALTAERNTIHAMTRGNNDITLIPNNLFTVDANGIQVQFAPGNLRYTRFTSSWSFAPEQYDFLGAANFTERETKKKETIFAAVIDLFSYGTKDHPLEYANNSTYYPSADLDNTTDWGYNFTPNYITLSKAQWEYLLNTRNQAIRYAKATLNLTSGTINGYLLFPDEYEMPDGMTAANSYSEISSTQWESLEANGFVFLPLAGSRQNDKLTYQSGDNQHYYWTSTVKMKDGHPDQFDKAYAMQLKADNNVSITAAALDNRSTGCAVRLARVYGAPTSPSSSK